LLALQKLFFALFNYPGKLGVLTTNILDPLLDQVNQKGFMRSLYTSFQRMRRFLSDKLGYFGFAIITVGHDFFHLLE
jgi:hypothetical protein